ARRALVLLYVKDLDSPQQATRLLGPSLNEALRTYIPLAAKDVGELAETACLELAQWYAFLASDASQVARAVCLLRARAYYRRFLEAHTRQDQPHLDARTGLAEVEKAIGKARPLDLAAAWLLRETDWRSFTAMARPLVATGLGALPLEEDVRAAVGKGTAFLLAGQQADGSWPALERYPAGPTALAACALLQSGLPANDPCMIKALDWLAKEKTTRTYTLALRCNVWMLAGRHLPDVYRQRCHRELLSDASLLAKSTSDGSYGYDCRGDGKSKGCNSNSQFGLWGVYCTAKALARTKQRVPAGYWPFVLRHWLTSQRNNGGWGYKKDTAASATMTAAGLFSVSACLESMGKSSRKLPAATKAVAWLEEHFDSVLEGRGQQPSGDLYYFLYAVARAQTIRGEDRLGKIEWYEEGKKVVLRKQAQDGSWNGRYGKLAATSLALLFLTQGRQTQGHPFAGRRLSGRPCHPGGRPPIGDDSGVASVSVRGQGGREPGIGCLTRG
ncbi:MAG: hypothetical protein WBF17_15710, partial [Phycisphaerae bacterium]